jgi:PAS domain S-box-containing protein
VSLIEFVSAAFVAVTIAAAVVFFRRNRDLEETIRRQLAREVALKARLDDLFDRSGDIIVVHDRRGRVSTINRAGEQLTGYLRDELRMLEPSWVFGAGYIDAIAHIIAEGVDSVPREFRADLTPRKGSSIPIGVYASVLIGDGDVVGVTVIAHDLSERERLEIELRQAQKMEAVGRLATGIAHDFNNLITVLLGYSDELIEGSPEGSSLRSAAVEVRRATDRASALTQQLLAFSRRQASVSHTVDVNQVIAHMEDLIRRLIGPEIRLRFNLQPDLAMISADPQQIGQVIMNLAVNARDAMPAGGELMIETANVELGDDNIDVIPGPHVELSVSDSGEGMTAEVRDRLFEPFFTTKSQGRGTGLGLSMVQAIVRQSGGHIKVESEPNQGTTFKAFFPMLADGAAAAVPELAAAPVAAIKGEGTVLLAEDDRSVRRLVVTELTRRGFTVLEADDGAAALEVFQREKDRVDVLVTDVVMPRMNGADLAAAVGRIRPGLKILFISGHPERAGAGLDPTGVTNLLMKPFTADTLASRIKALITGRSEADGWSV